MRESRYVSLEVAAQQLGRSVPWVKSRLLEGVLTARLAANRWLISAESLERFDVARLPSESSAAVHNFLPERLSTRARSSNVPRKGDKLKSQGRPSGKSKPPVRVAGSSKSSRAGQSRVPKKGNKKKMAGLPAETIRSPRGVSRVAARNYLYERLSELKQQLIAGGGTHREEIARELAFVEAQLELVNGKDQTKILQLDPSLEKDVLEHASKPRRSTATKTPNPAASKNKRRTKSDVKKTKNRTTNKRKKEPDLPWSGGFSNRNSGWGYPF